ncbi:flagellar brake domain-containing protein [Paenibacillus oenotherae]|uniref:Flagellar brake domain-containing protein n=1 Tax=Paenibacillus oenotherae TaxID=1435645 RepID=A0ABS7D1L3_9BACL|nr:flagellar brake domain-containing protein [Paenibacillus oenotherae]MBW7473472.1 flagellar brake domain-containing protein [Paenibacillus oenotherae]
MLPKVKQLLFIQVASSDEEEAAIEYKSRVEDEDEGELLIDVPIIEGTGKYKRLFLGDELSLYFVSGEGVKHYFNSHVLGFKEEVVKLIRIRKPELSAITSVQRRSFLRVEAELEIAVKMSAHVRFIGMTDDVGGGGISFLCDGRWPVKAGQELDCWLLIPYRNGSLEHAQFKAEIVRVKATETGRNQIMAKFVTISDLERQKIIRFCFERQLDYRKN